MRELKQSTSHNLMVFMTDSTDHVAGKEGLTLAITASKNGAAFGSITPTVTERGDGWYNLALTTSHTDTLGDLALHVTATGADPTDLVSRIIAMDKNSLFATADQLASICAVEESKQVVGGTGNDTTHVHLTLASSYGDDQLNDRLLYILDQSTGELHSRWIEDWVASTQLATVDPPLPFTPVTGTPSSGDLYWLTSIRRDVDACKIAGSQEAATKQAAAAKAVYTGTVETGSDATNIVDSGLTSAQINNYSGRVLAFITGALTHQARVIVSFDPDTDTVTLQSAFTTAPTNGDQYDIL